MDITSTITLNNGVKMPRLGLGVYKSEPGEETEQAVRWALEAGYRHIDTAARYGNEESVGKAVRESGIPREEIFVTTKLWNEDHDDPEAALDESLRKLDLGYIDLYLLHAPVEDVRNATWQTLEQVISANEKVRAIGVSNFTARHLEELLGIATIVPAVNQVEFTPFLYQKELLEYCRDKQIALEAYSPLAKGKKFDHQMLQAIAKKYRKTPAQVILRWSLQHDLIAIPKSVSQERIKENAGLYDFEIDSSDMSSLDGLHENLRLAWDPTNIP